MAMLSSPMTVGPWIPPSGVHVLSLLPVKSICQFKAVSPSWNSLNSSPQFAQTHLHLTNHTTNKSQKIILVSPSSRALYSVDLSAVNPTAEKLDFPSAESPEVLGSCHGLVLVSGRGNDSKFLWNPSLENARNCPNTQSLGICLLYNVFYLEWVTTRRQMITRLWCSFTVYVLSMVIKWLCIDAWRLEYPEVPDGFYFNERLHRLLLLLICRVRF